MRSLKIGPEACALALREWSGEKSRAPPPHQQPDAPGAHGEQPFLQALADAPGADPSGQHQGLPDGPGVVKDAAVRKEALHVRDDDIARGGDVPGAHADVRCGGGFVARVCPQRVRV